MLSSPPGKIFDNAISKPRRSSEPALAHPAVDAPVSQVLDGIRADIAAILGHASADAISANTAFNQIGLDSLTTIELRNRISGRTGIQLPATFVYDWPTPESLADHLRKDLAATVSEPADTTLGRREHGRP